MKMNKFVKGFLIYLAICILGFLFSMTDENNENTIENTNIAQETKTPAPTEMPIPLTEEEYKAACIEMYYDEVFFGDENLEGKYVKLHLMLSEKFYFTLDGMAGDSYQTFNKEYNLNRDFYKCCVLREGENSYVGIQIDMWFSDNYDFKPSDYNLGDKITVYAEVIDWGNASYDGYNDVTIIPKYIEK